MICNRGDGCVQLYARLAGFLYLFIIAIFDAADYFVIDPATVAGDFARTAQNITASETLYRIALAAQFAASWLAIPLATALYVLVKRVDANLALFALVFRVAEAALGSICTISSFVSVRLYTGTAGAFPPAESQALVQLLTRFYSGCFQATVIFFSAGSVMFFYLLLRSRMIPRALSGLGIFSSVLVTLLGFANLIVPRYSGTLAPSWIAILVAEVLTGLWLLIRGVNLEYWNSREARA